MRTVRGVILVVAVVALPMTLAATASGKPPASTTTTVPAPAGGHTCAELGFGQGLDEVTWTYDQSGRPASFSFTMSGGRDDSCVDVTTDVAGSWHVTGTASGVSSLSLIPRDSASPGDSCGGVGLKRPTVLDMDLPKVIPAATVNACGTAYGEWIEGVLVMEAQPLATHPLAFIAQMLGRTGAYATITVELPLP